VPRLALARGQRMGPLGGSDGRHVRVTSESRPSHVRVTSESCPSHIRVTSESRPSHVRVTSESRPSHIRVTSESHPSHVRVTSESRPSHVRVTSESHGLDPESRDDSRAWRHDRARRALDEPGPPLCGGSGGAAGLRVGVGVALMTCQSRRGGSHVTLSMCQRWSRDPEYVSEVVT
jgi:hypothetical protein